MGRAHQTSLTSHDVAIWHTCHINELVAAGRLHEWRSFAPTFALMVGGDERVLEHGPFELYDYGPLGDGTYQHDNSFVFATGRTGLAATVGFAAGRAIGNARRRRQAGALAQSQWHQIESGAIWVSQYGFYLMPGHGGLLSWSWKPIQAAEIIDSGLLLFSGESDRGSVTWSLRTDWAELILTLWARAIQPQHPQFASASWVPPGWVGRVRQSSTELPPVQTPDSPLRELLGGGEAPTGG